MGDVKASGSERGVSGDRKYDPQQYDGSHCRDEEVLEKPVGKEIAAVCIPPYPGLKGPHGLLSFIGSSLS